jgi:hypothetical protein
MKIYIEQLENIIRDMQNTLPKPDYLPWLHFLHEVYLESELLKPEEEGAPQARDPTIEIADPIQKECRDIRELMMLAEQNGYPTWRIHPYVEEGLPEEYEPILFPTDKIQTISSHNLQELFKRYLSTLREEGMAADAILIKSDSKIMATDGQTYASLIFRLTNN